MSTNDYRFAAFKVMILQVPHPVQQQDSSQHLMPLGGTGLRVEQHLFHVLQNQLGTDGTV
jgi:hypothetical protein